MRTGLLAGLLALAAAPARASFEETGAGARAPGLGDAFTALADDAYAAHYNPAGLAQLERPQLGTAYSRLYTGLSDGSDIGSSQFVFARPVRRGKKGTLAFSWERFSLGGLYSEQTLGLSYGRRLYAREDGRSLMLGGSFKYLSHSFTRTGETAASCDVGQCTGGVDPVLAGSNSKSTPDLDFGLIYRFPRRFQLGLGIQHLMSPNVGFSGSDKLERAINLGGAYKSLWLSLIGELRMRKAASGAMGRDMIVAAERYFPTLDFGQFGLRGSIGFGADEWRQVTMGASYRVNKIQADYAFILPVGAVQAQSGSHRLGLTFHFGAPTTDEEIGRDLLEQAKRLREQGPDYGYEYSEELKPQTLDDPRLADVKRLIEERRYRMAHKRLVEIAEAQPLSQPMIRLSNRLDMAGFHYADLTLPQTRFEETLVAGLKRFLYGEDRLAMLQVSYAYSMKPEDVRLSHLLEGMEKALGIKAERLPSGHPRTFMDEMLYQVEFAHTRGDAGRVEALLSDILVLEPDNSTALSRLGSLRFLTGRPADAIPLWERALKIETRERELDSLKEYLRIAKERASGKVLPGEATAPAEATEAARRAAVEDPAPARRIQPLLPRPEQASGDPRDVQRLYQKGVEHYARGEYLQASAMFLRILQIDPENEQAKKALERIERRRPAPRRQ